MAGRIETKDLVSPEIKKELDEITKSLDTLVKTISKVNDESVKLKESFDKGAKSQREMSDNVSKVNTTMDALSQSEREIIKIEKQTLDLQAKIIAERGHENKILQNLKNTRSELNKQIRENIKEEKNEIKYGKIAEDSLVRKRQKLKDLTTAYDRAGDKLRQELVPEIRKLSNEIRQSEQLTNRHQSDVGRYGKAWEGFKSKILPVFAAFTAGNAIIKVAKVSMESIQSTADSLGRVMSSLKVGTNLFMRSLASGDFTNFLTNMKEAVKVGKEYYDILDDIADINNAIKIQEADARRFILDRLTILRDELSTNEQRIKAADEIIAKEDELAAKKAKTTGDELRAELELASFKSKLSNDEIVRYLRDYDQNEQLRKQGDEYNQMLKERKELETITLTGGTAQDIQDLTRINTILKSATINTMEWARVQRGMDQLNDEQRVKIVQLYEAWKDAENSALENSQRVLSRRSVLLDETLRNEQKIIEKANEEDVKRTIDQDLKKIELKDFVFKTETEKIIANIELAKSETIAAYAEEIDNFEEKELLKREISNQSFEFFNALNERQISNIEAQKEYELQLAWENAGERERIEKKYDAERRKIQRRQALIDKGQAVFNTILNSKEAITKAMTKDPTGILAAFNSVLLGAQLATILATPIPKFKKGTKYSPEGLAIVGEAGRELIEYPTGRMALTPDSATMTYLPKGSKVHTNEETEKMVQTLTDAKLDKLISITERNYNKKQYVNSTTITDEGLKRATTDGNNYTKWIDTYFRK